MITPPDPLKERKLLSHEKMVIFSWVSFAWGAEEVNKDSKKRVGETAKILWLRQESNLDLGLRKPTYYPLYYEAGRLRNY